MPFVEEVEDKPVEQPSLLVSKEPFQGPVVDTRKTQYSTLSTFYQGQKWAVDYYRQVNGRDSTVQSFSKDTPVTYGTYRLIRGFELVVESAITNDQNSSEANGFDSTGSGIVYHCVVPQNGDVFIADFGNGRNVLFAIYNPKKLGVYEESPHRVEWKAVEFVDDALFKRLESSLTDTLYFDRENFRNNLKCLLNKGEVDSIRRLNNAWRRLINLYFKDFFSDDFSTFVMPGQYQQGVWVPTYDPNLVKYLRKTLSVEQHPAVHKMIELDCSGDPSSDQLSLFDMLAKRDWELLYSCSHHFNAQPVDCYRSYPKLHSVYFSGIRRVVSARDISFTVNHPRGVMPGSVLEIMKAGPERPEMRAILPQLVKGGTEPAPSYGRFIKRVLCDDYYVFSKEFYTGDGEVSMLERMVQHRMKGEAIDLVDLAELADYAPRFDNLERFYYIPIILTLIKLAPGVL